MIWGTPMTSETSKWMQLLGKKKHTQTSQCGPQPILPETSAQYNSPVSLQKGGRYG